MTTEAYGPIRRKPFESLKVEREERSKATSQMMPLWWIRVSSFSLPSMLLIWYGHTHTLVTLYCFLYCRMDTLSSIYLGIIQGATEFLPISSSGHLVLFQNLLGFREPQLLVDSALHLGTLMAICLYFHSDLKNMMRETWKFTVDLGRRRKSLKSIDDQPYASLTLWVLLGTLPTLVIGLVFRSFLENLFGSVTGVGIMLLFTGLILAMAKLLPPDYSRREKVGLLIALAVGTAQGISLVPGISRSGTTIVCGMIFGLKRDLAARFSFLLSTPAIIGAVLLQLSVEGLDNVDLMPLTLGFIVSALVGLMALKILMGLVRKGNLFYFAPYCWGLGLFMVFM